MEKKDMCQEYYNISSFFHKEYVKCNEFNNNLQNTNIVKQCNELYDLHKKYDEKYMKEIEKRS